MKSFTEHLDKALMGKGDAKRRPSDELVSLLARCHLKTGDWQMELEEEWSETNIPQILTSFSAATQCDQEWYKAWHAWSFANSEVLGYYERKSEGKEGLNLEPYVMAAVKGFVRSIALSKGNSLQDTLRLLTLWFRYGYQPNVHACMVEGFSSVSIDTWLQVIPQVKARDSKS